MGTSLFSIDEPTALHLLDQLLADTLAATDRVRLSTFLQDLAEKGETTWNGHVMSELITRLATLP
jgi:hypothetical protein